MACNKQEYYVVLVGKTGHGKSATGNSLLGWKAFFTSDSSGSVTDDCKLESSARRSQQINVVDTPGLFDTGKNNTRDILEKLLTVMSYCPYGIDAFILVLNYRNKFTPEEYKTFCILKDFFGPEFLKTCIVVFTHGDVFENNDDNKGQPFSKWLQESQKKNENLKKLIEMCNNKTILFYNNKKFEEKKQIAVDQLWSVLIKTNTRYTHENFMKASEARKILVASKKLPQLQAKYQIALSLICEKFTLAALSSETPSAEQIADISKKIHQLLELIDEDDLGTKYLAPFEEKVKKLQKMVTEKNLVAEKIGLMIEYMYCLKNPPLKWDIIPSVAGIILSATGGVCSTIGALVFPPLVGFTVAYAACAAVCVIKIVKFKNECDEHKRKMAELETELLK